jgi:hypothetical protein
LRERVKGRVFTFPFREILDPVGKYYEEFGSMFSSYVYVEGNVLMRIVGDVRFSAQRRHERNMRDDLERRADLIFRLLYSFSCYWTS